MDVKEIRPLYVGDRSEQYLIVFDFNPHQEIMPNLKYLNENINQWELPNGFSRGFVFSGIGFAILNVNDD